MYRVFSDYQTIARENSLIEAILVATSKAESNSYSGLVGIWSERDEKGCVILIRTKEDAETLKELALLAQEQWKTNVRKECAARLPKEEN